MRLATIRHEGTTTAVRIDEEAAVVLPFLTLRELLESGSDWKAAASAVSGPRLELGSLDFAPVVPTPEKIICTGLNYREHAAEANLDVTGHPVLFAKYSRSLIGAFDKIVLPPTSDQVDWEVELTVVIGQEVRDADAAQARAAIAGYTIMNDISMRDWQFRTSQFLQGKTFESSTPVGPYLVTLDELDDPDSLALSCDVNGSTVQKSTTDALIFSVTDLVAYASSIITLVPGDLLATGTPSGVGVARKPPVFLGPDDVVSCEVEGLGRQSNLCVVRQPASVSGS